MDGNHSTVTIYYTFSEPGDAISLQLRSDFIGGLDVLCHTDSGLSSHHLNWVRRSIRNLPLGFRSVITIYRYLYDEENDDGFFAGGIWRVNQVDPRKGITLDCLCAAHIELIQVPELSTQRQECLEIAVPYAKSLLWEELIRLAQPPDKIEFLGYEEMTTEEDIGKMYEVGRQFGHEAFPEYAWKLAFLCTREDRSSHTEQVVFAGYYPDDFPFFFYQYERDNQVNVFFL